jgi:hypothetical protein
MANHLKHDLDQLSKALQDLHRSMLMSEAKLVAAEYGRPLTSYELLNASLNNPTLAWLRQLSSLIVEIDTIVDEAPNLGAQETNLVTVKTLALLDPAGDLPPTEFWEKYTRSLREQPELILKHARVKDLVAALAPRM